MLPKLTETDGKPGWFASMEDEGKVGVVAILAAAFVLSTGLLCGRSCSKMRQESCHEAIKAGNAEAVKTLCTGGP